MKFQAPDDVTAISFEGETIALDGDRQFETADERAGELAAHGCAPVAPDGSNGAANRTRSGARKERRN